MEENRVEQRSKFLIELVLGRPLTPWDHNDGTMKPDYRALAAPRISFEVKQVTVQEFHQMDEAIRRAGRFDSAVLRQRWTVMLSLPTLDKKLQPSGRVRKPSVPQIKTLTQDLEPLLAELEDKGIAVTRSASLKAGDAWMALQRFERLTRGGIGTARPPRGGESPGIDLERSYVFSRTRDPNDLVDRLRAYLASPLASNLMETLATAPVSDERHAVLLIDHTYPEYYSMDEWRDKQLPTALLPLPTNIDRVWVVGPLGLIWWCGRNGPWEGRDLREFLAA